jgi:hypothetical protein
MTENDMEQCVKQCWRCIDTCKMLMRLIERNSPQIGELSNVCAIVCELCADACKAFDSDYCQRCAASCRECASICQQVASTAA